MLVDDFTVLIWLAVIIGVTIFLLACLIFVMLLKASRPDEEERG